MYTKGDCIPGLECKYDELQQDNPGICVEPGTIDCVKYIVTVDKEAWLYSNFLITASIIISLGHNK